MKNYTENDDDLRKQYLKIKQEHEIYKELRKKLGLSSSNYINIKEMKRNLQHQNWLKKNE